MNEVIEEYENKLESYRSAAEKLSETAQASAEHANYLRESLVSIFEQVVHGQRAIQEEIEKYIDSGVCTQIDASDSDIRAISNQIQQLSAYPIDKASLIEYCWDLIKQHSIRISVSWSFNQIRLDNRRTESLSDSTISPSEVCIIYFMVLFVEC